MEVPKEFPINHAVHLAHTDEFGNWLLQVWNWGITMAQLVGLGLCSTKHGWSRSPDLSVRLSDSLMSPSPLNTEKMERRRNERNNHRNDFAVGARTGELEGMGGTGGQRYPSGTEQELKLTEQSLFWEEK